MNPIARFQVNIANIAAEFILTGHPSIMGGYGQESGGFSRPGENQSMSRSDNQAGEEGDLIMEVGGKEGAVEQDLGSKVVQGW